ncbi:MAG: SGNH/GDSL hydrolase family protein [Candidatus Omnitrophota bacterium]
MAKRLKYTVLILLFTFICGELFVRIYDLYAGINGYSHNNLEFIYIPNSYYNYSFRPGAVARIDRKDHKEIRINSLGYRGDDFGPVKPEGTFRIICFGGSSTFGVYEKDNSSTWPALLERRLRGAGSKKKIEVINAAGPGYTTFESLSRYINEAVNFSPDLIIVYHTINDAYLSGKIRADKPVEKVRNFHRLHNPLNRFLLHSRLYSLVYSLAQQRYLSRCRETVPKDADLSFSRRAFKRNLSLFVSASQEGNVRLILATQLIDGAKCPPWLVPVVEDYTAIIREVSAKYRLTLVDTQTLISGEGMNTLLNDEVHFNSTGNEWLSDIFAQKIKDEGFLEEQL